MFFDTYIEVSGSGFVNTPNAPEDELIYEEEDAIIALTLLLGKRL